MASAVARVAVVDIASSAIVTTDVGVLAVTGVLSLLALMLLLTFGC